MMFLRPTAAPLLLITITFILYINKMVSSQMRMTSPDRIFHKSPYLIKRDSTKYCGQNLVAALQVVCNGIYNPMFKKSIYSHYSQDPNGNYRNWLSMEDNNSENNDGVEIVPLHYPFKSRTSAVSLAPPGTFRRRSRGVYDECCRKSCTYREMAGYCGGGGSR